MYMCLMCYALALFIFCVLVNLYAGNFCTRFKLTLMTRKIFRCVGLSSMEALHSREGNDHPHKQPNSTVNINTREVVEGSASEMVQLLAAVPFKH